LIVFSFVLILAGMIFNYFKWKLKHKMQDREAGSLRTSELKEMMREAVVEANAPLLDRIDMLEARMEDLAVPRLGPAEEEPLVDVSLTSEVQPPAQGRTSR